MTTKEMIEVLQAYDEGKTIQCYSTSEGEWFDIINPEWDFSCVKYRIKPEPKMRPYNSAKEFLEASKEHGPYLLHNVSTFCYIPTVVRNSEIVIVYDYKDTINKMTYYYSELLENMVWQDGTKCGEIVKDE